MLVRDQVGQGRPATEIRNVNPRPSGLALVGVFPNASRAGCTVPATRDERIHCLRKEVKKGTLGVKEMGELCRCPQLRDAFDGLISVIACIKMMRRGQRPRFAKKWAQGRSEKASTPSQIAAAMRALGSCIRTRCTSRELSELRRVRPRRSTGQLKPAETRVLLWAWVTEGACHMRRDWDSSDGSANLPHDFYLTKLEPSDPNGRKGQDAKRRNQQTPRLHTSSEALCEFGAVCGNWAVNDLRCPWTSLCGCAAT